MAVIACWRSGQVEVLDTEPPGAIVLMRGHRSHLKRRLEARARHAYDGETLLVPGVPEAETDDEAVDAAIAFSDFLKKGGA